MRTVYGLKMFTIDDIIDATAGKPSICEDIKKNPSVIDGFEDYEVMEINTGIGGNFPVHNLTKPYRFLFVSIDLFEEKMIIDSFIDNLRSILPKLLVVSRAEKVARIIDKYTEIYETYSNKYSGDNIINSPCLVLIFDEDKIIDVYTAIPSDILNSLSEPIKYICNVCGHSESAINSSMEGFIPDMYYDTSNDGIKYLCNNHRSHSSKHVGE